MLGGVASPAIVTIIANGDLRHHQDNRMLRSIWVSEEVWDLVHSNVDLAHLVIIMVMVMTITMTMTILFPELPIQFIRFEPI